MNTTKGEQTRARVIDAAITIMNRKGINNTSIQDIIDETGVKKGNLYFHFGSKDDLGMNILREAWKNYFNYLTRNIRSPDPRGKINDILRSVLERHRSMGFVGGCIFGNTALEMSDSGTQHAGLVREIFDEWMKLLEGLLGEAGKRGELPDGVRPKPMARFIVSSMEGAIMLARLYKRGDPIEECIANIRRLIGLK